METSKTERRWLSSPLSPRRPWGPGYRDLSTPGELSNTFGRTERVLVSWNLWTVPYAWLYVYGWHQTVMCHCKEAVLHNLPRTKPFLANVASSFVGNEPAATHICLSCLYRLLLPVQVQFHVDFISELPQSKFRALLLATPRP